MVPVVETSVFGDNVAMHEEASRLAEAQLGVVALYQLRNAGLSVGRIRRLSTSAEWEHLTPKVVRRRGSPRTKEQRVAALVYHSGPQAFLSHASAAALWGHRGSSINRPVHISRLGSKREIPPGARVHRVRALPERWTTVLSGIPVVRPEFVALHLFATMHYERAERIVESMWSRKLLTSATIGDFLSTMARRGRNGTAGLRLYIDARGESYVPPDSGLEGRVDQILRNASIPMRRQVDAGDGERWLGRVDFRHETRPVILEVQSEFHHCALVDRRADQVRLDSLRSAGFRVVEVTDHEVWTDPSTVESRVRRSLDALAA